MRQRDTRAMIVPEADRSSSEVRVTKLSPEEIDKIFKDVKPEEKPYKTDYSIKPRAEDFDPAWLFDRPQKDKTK